MEASIFTKIIRGEIPSYKIYENDAVYAFLDIYPVQPGHVLIVPKEQIDRLEDIPEPLYYQLMDGVKLLAKHLREELGVQRVALKVEGFDVPHAHIHLIPCREAEDFYVRPDRSVQPNHEALKAMAEKLALS